MVMDTPPGDPLCAPRQAATSTNPLVGNDEVAYHRVELRMDELSSNLDADRVFLEQNEVTASHSHPSRDRWWFSACWSAKDVAVRQHSDTENLYREIGRRPSYSKARPRSNCSANSDHHKRVQSLN
jgi:hypothetical protein